MIRTFTEYSYSSLKFKLKGMQVKSLKCGSKGEKRHPDGNYDLRVRCESGDNVD